MSKILDIPDEVILQIIKSCETHSALEKMSNDQIGELIINHILNYVPMWSPVYDLLDVAIDRLKAKQEGKKWQRVKSNGLK